jgi:hypothetical protein
MGCWNFMDRATGTVALRKSPVRSDPYGASY